VTIGNNVSSIDKGTFRCCYSLTSITIGNSVISIEIAAFILCTNLASITIPESVKSIGSAVFADCTSLASVTFKGTIPSNNFDMNAFGIVGNNYIGDLREKYLAGGPGTYTRRISNGTWTNTTGGNPTNGSGIELVYLENANNKDFAIEARLDAEQWSSVTSSSWCLQALQQISKEIYAKFRDDFDFIFFVLNTKEDIAITNELGFGVNVRVSNSVKGIGIQDASTASSYGSAGNLKSIMYFPFYDAILRGPTLHEIAHNWGANICPTYTLGSGGDVKYNPHWGVSNAGGQLGGAKYIREIQTFSDGSKEYQGSMDGTFTDGFGDNANGGNGLVYSDIELYLMGMIGADVLRANNFRLNIYSGLSASSTSGEGYFKATKVQSYTIDDLINIPGIGVRVPDASVSQKTFKVLTVILSNDQDSTASTRHDKIVKDVKWFAGLHQDTEGWKAYNFKQATRDIGSLEVGGITNSLKK
jgi:hypothetical protein